MKTEWMANAYGSKGIAKCTFQRKEFCIPLEHYSDFITLRESLKCCEETVIKSNIQTLRELWETYEQHATTNFLNQVWYEYSCEMKQLEKLLGLPSNGEST